MISNTCYRATPYNFRVDTVLHWLSGLKGGKADFVSLYISNVDKAGHDGGVHSKLVNIICFNSSILKVLSFYSI